MIYKIKQFLGVKRNLIILYVVFAIVASLQSLCSGPKHFNESEVTYTKYNNYVIFKNSFYHLKDNKDLYIHYPEEHWDLYKYTPTFSAFFSVFTIFPDWLGLTLWNLLNALVLLMAVYYLPRLSLYQKALVLVIVLIELMTSMQNEQSNALIAGLLVFAFGMMEKDKPIWATLMVVLSAFVKLFGVVGFAIFIFYPKKWKSMLFSAVWLIVLLLVPFVFIGPNQYLFLMDSFLNMLANDHSASYGYSVMGWLNSWFLLEPNKNIIVLVGVLLFLLPFIKLQSYKNVQFKYLALASVLLWIVIFNHKAESPTFIIAMVGVALWYINAEKTMINRILFISAFVFTSLSPTDIFPPFIRNEFFKPYAIKGVPCILIWCKVIYDMAVFKIKESEVVTSLES